MLLLRRYCRFDTQAEVQIFYASNAGTSEKDSGFQFATRRNARIVFLSRRRASTNADEVPTHHAWLHGSHVSVGEYRTVTTQIDPDQFYVPPRSDTVRAV